MKIQVPKPCHEDWNKMNLEEKGRFCGSCQKLVVDFSSMKDDEIISYFKQYEGSQTCGHFKKNQINRTLKEPTSIPIRKFFLKELAAACVAFFLSTSETKAQTENTAFVEKTTSSTSLSDKEKMEIAINGKVLNGSESLKNATISIKGTNHKTTSLENGIFSIFIPSEIARKQDKIILVAEYENLSKVEITVTGNISSADGVLLGAVVVVKGTNRGVSTDMDGNYSLVVPKGATLVFSFIGYLSQEVTVEDKTVINVELQDAEFLGLIVVGYSVTNYRWYTPKNLWHRFRNIFK